jgi:hypothetical protein
VLNIDIVLYFHILSATAWIGGSLLLFALGIILRDKTAQKQVYFHLGPIYGYFETFWLISLWSTGLMLFFYFGFDELLVNDPKNLLSQWMQHKLTYVVALTFLTLIHMVIAFKTHNLTRSTFLNIVSRGSSLLIFFLNLGILWVAIQIRNLL